MSKAKAVVRLKSEETIANASGLKKRLLNALKKKADVSVDGSKVTEIDSAALQVLVAAKKSALSRGQGLSIANPSPELSRLLALTELDGIFGL